MSKYVGIFDKFEVINTVHKIKEVKNSLCLTECGKQIYVNDFCATVITQEQVNRMKANPGKYYVKYCECQPL